MIVLNFNETIRDYILNYFSGIDVLNDKNADKMLYELLNKFKSQENYNMIIAVMFQTALMINYTTYKLYPNDKISKENYEFLASFESLFEVIKNLDFNMFKNMCNDVISFSSSDFYLRKKYVINSFDIKDMILKTSKLFFIDYIYYSKKIDKSFIMDYFYLNGYENKRKCINETAAYASDELIKLQDVDIENYKEVIKDIIDDFYKYNNYKLGNNLKILPSKMDAYEMIEDGTIIDYSLQNKPLLKTLLKDYVSFNLSDKITKENVNLFRKPDSDFQKYMMYNKNNVIRKKIYEEFYLVSSIDVDDNLLEKQLEKFENIRYDEDFDYILEIMYNDAMTILTFNYYAGDGLEESEKEVFEFLNNLNDISEFKDSMKENPELFLELLMYVYEFLFASTLERKEYIHTLANDNCYNKFLVKRYILDSIEASVKYDLKDTLDIYNNYVLSDEEEVIENSVDHLISDLENLYIMDKNNYNYIIRKILRIYYMYCKYLITSQNLSADDVKNIKLMEKNINKFINLYNKDSDVKHNVLYLYYEYISLKDYERDIIKNNFYEMDKNGKIKIFNKKNKNSD